MARVYEAWDRVLDRRVAVKVLDDRLTDEPSLVARFGREARAAAGLAHPNVVAVHDAGQDGPVPFIVMELIDGTSLADRLEGGPLATREAAAIAADVCLALDHAHRRGVVHRDIKPGNILLDGDGRVKVTDFGIAKVAAFPGTTGGGSTAGTAEYLAPEQAWSERVDARADLYALGCCLYEMLTGAPPFGTVGDPLTEGGPETGDQLTSVQIAVRHLLQPPVPPRQRRPGIPERLDQVVVRVLAKRPDDRQHSAEELRQDLLSFSRRPATRSRPPAKPPGRPEGPPPRPPPRPPAGVRGRDHAIDRRVAIAGLAGLALVAAAVTVDTLAPASPPGPDGSAAPGRPSEAAGAGAGTATSQTATTGAPATEPPATEPPATRRPPGRPATTAPPATAPPGAVAPAGEPRERVPNVVGLHQDEASAMLSSQGLGTEVQAIPTRHPDRLQQVLSQDPAAGTTIPRGRSVKVVVAQWLDANATD